jgi:hypothetical protein
MDAAIGPAVHADPPAPAQDPPERLWRRWFAWVTAAEAVGFAVPAVVGAATSHLPGSSALLWLLPAGAVEGAGLGAAQAHVLHSALAGLSRPRWITATSAAAILAYILGFVPSSAGDRLWGLPLPVVTGIVTLLAAGLLGSIGTAQWLVLRRHLSGPASWIAWTAAAWLMGLAVFMIIASPLWHEGQALWLTITVGVVAGSAMAATVVAVTGLGLIRVLRGRPTVHSE